MIYTMIGRISIDELAQRRDEILNGISTRDECWEICANPNDLSQHGFILGPASLLGNVLGLVDEEYGWPITIDATAAIEEFRPRHRGHPFIVRDNELIAISVDMGEYIEICELSGKAIPNSLPREENNPPTDIFISHPTKHADDLNNDATT